MYIYICVHLCLCVCAHIYISMLVVSWKSNSTRILNAYTYMKWCTYMHVYTHEFNTLSDKHGSNVRTHHAYPQLHI